MDTHSDSLDNEFSQQGERQRALSFGDASEPLTAVLARALMYSKDAERELEQARALKLEAERYRSQVQHETVEKVEAFCNSLREKVEEEMRQARRALEEAEAKEETATAALKEAEAARHEAGEYASKVKGEADEYSTTVRAEADAEAKSLVEQARADLQEEIKAQHMRVDEEVRRALAGIEKMQAAVQEELAAQKLFTEAVRIRAFTPKQYDDFARQPAPRQSTVRLVETPARSRVARRQRAAS